MNTVEKDSNLGLVGRGPNKSKQVLACSMDKSGTGSVIGVCQLGVGRTHRPESPDLPPGRRPPRPGSRVLFEVPVKGRDLGQKTGFPFLGLCHPC